MSKRTCSVLVALGACATPIDTEVDEAALAGAGLADYWILSDTVARVNRASTVCADGARRACCALDDVDLSALGADPGDLQPALDEPYAAVVRGALIEDDVGAARLIVTQAWRAGAAAGWPSGLGVEVAQTEIRCVQWPCEDMSERALNLPDATRIAELDFGPSDATDPEIAAAMAALLPEGGASLLVFGHRYVVTGAGGASGKARSVSQLYLPLSDGALLSPEQCEAIGGRVRGDIGDGQIACAEDEVELGRVAIGIEGGVCCR